jgi:hypothetical protein
MTGQNYRRIKVLSILSLPNFGSTLTIFGSTLSNFGSTLPKSGSGTMNMMPKNVHNEYLSFESQFFTVQVHLIPNIPGVENW